MKNKDFYKNNRKYIIASICAFTVLVCSDIFTGFIRDFKVMDYAFAIFDVLTPFFYGLVIAYLLNFVTAFLEDRVFMKIKKGNIKRIVSVSVAYVVFIGFLAFLICYIVPEVVISIQNVVQNIVVFVQGINIYEIENRIGRFIYQNSYYEDFEVEVTKYLTDVIDKGFDAVINSTKYVPDVINKLIIGTVGFAYKILDFVIGLFISFYLLCDKENFSTLARKTLYTFVPRGAGAKIIMVLTKCDFVFRKFFVGKLIDSLIIGILFFIGALFIDPPYVLLLSLIIGVTNMIPYFGPFMGGIPVTIIVFMSDPIKAIWIGIFILILQQFDGIVLGPKILGDSTGLKPIGVIFSIIIGGALFGPLGMFFGVPVFAVISTMYSEFLERKYDEKIEAEKGI